MFPDLGVGDELDAFGGHEIDAALHDLLVELHVRDAVHEQAADAVVAFEHGDQMAGPVELRGGGQAGRAGADDGDFLAGAQFRRFGDDPAFVQASVDDRALDVLDRDGRCVDAQHARAFARRGADAAGELGEVVRLVQPLERFLPQPAIDEIVPLGNEVVDRATARHARQQRAGVAERNAAVHAPRALFLQLVLRHVKVKFHPVCDPLLSATDPAEARADIPEILWVYPWLLSEQTLTMTLNPTKKSSPVLRTFKVNGMSLSP